MFSRLVTITADNRIVQAHNQKGVSDPRSTRPFSRSLFDEYGRARLARVAPGTVGSHLSHAAYVDPDCRQDSSRPYPTAEPLVEYGSVCEYARFDDFTDSVPWRRV